jgi:hypothetical protein
VNSSSIRRAARTDHKHAVDAYKAHLHLCLACSRHVRGDPMMRCQRGDELAAHLERTARQLAIIDDGLDSAWVQSSMFGDDEG